MPLSGASWADSRGRAVTDESDLAAAGAEPGTRKLFPQVGHIIDNPASASGTSTTRSQAGQEKRITDATSTSGVVG
jgi:hypothetical protein